MFKYKVLVADDEYWSRVNLQKLAPWEEYSIEFLEPACDGKEVLDRIPEEKPDIVITDINMPFVDGLELLNAINGNYPEIVTIAVSGYDDFDKVKGTFMAGGIDYLLKPVGKDQLKAVIEKAINKLEENSSRRQKQLKNTQEMEYANSAITDSEKSAILSSSLHGDRVEETIGREISCVSIFVKFHDIDELAKKYGFKMHEMSYDIKQRILKMIRNFRPGTEPLIFCYSPKVNEFLICMDADAPFLKRVANGILMEFGIDKYGPVTVIIRENPDLSEPIGTVYREIIACLMTRNFAFEHSILTLDRTKNIESVRKISKSLEKNILDCIDKGKKTELKRLVLEETGLNDCNDGSWTLMDLGQFTAQLFSLLIPAKNTAEDILELKDEINESVRYDTMKLNREGVLSDIEALCNLVCQEKAGGQNTSINELTEKIHDRIETNFNEHITLSALAEEFFVDPSYISRTFSKMYGETIMAFIARKRIEKAVELIRQGENTLEEISFEVGYDDYNYFSRVFKKQTGLRPSEYKTSNKNKENA